MRINPMELPHAVPGEPLVVERYYVQRSVQGPLEWVDAVHSGNLKGIPSLEEAQQALIFTRDGYANDVKCRVVKRTCTVKTEVVQ